MRIDEIDRLVKEATKEWEERVKDKDLFEVVEEVFDTSTILTIVELYRRGVLRRLSGVISAGKEARVYLGYGRGGEPIALKIYLTSSAEFRRGIYKYIIGDPRFEGLKIKDTRSLIYTWARKEYRNLSKMHEAGVKVPKPIACLNNVLVMEFIGEGRERYPLLVEAYRELTMEELGDVYRLVLEELEKIVCRARLVHGDLSEYNVMLKPELDIVVIDVGQAVDVNHPNALDFLKRDVENINRFFKREAGIEVEDDEVVFKRVLSCLEKRKEGL
jgi:RIO kinase 1